MAETSLDLPKGDLRHDVGFPLVRRLLLIAYHFPPLAGPGVFRPLRLVKYLPRFGWTTTVVTVSDRVRLLKDPDLARDVPPGTSVMRTATLEPRTFLIALGKLGMRHLADRIERYFMVPDDQRGWVPFASRAAFAASAARPHDLVLSTSAPYSCHLAGARVHRRTGLPWIADFRDDWTTNPYLSGRYPTRWHRRLNRRWQRAILTDCDRVVTVSHPWAELLHQQVPDQARSKFRVIENGFDAEHHSQKGGPPNRFSVLYTGTFYGHRTADTIARAIRTILETQAIPSSELSVEIIGHSGSLSEFGDWSSGTVRISGHRPYFATLQEITGAAVLLLSVPAADGPGKHTAKLYHYLASGRPIIALAPDENVGARLVRDTRSGLVVAPDDAAGLVDALVALYHRYKAGTLLPDQDREAILAYEAEAQTRRWVELFEEVCASRPA